MPKNQGNIFKLHSSFKPAGDQPKAISELIKGLGKGMKKQTLLGATGTGKTFTMANVIAEYNKPTLVIAHNKTLAAQLAQEFREFFPDAAVHYFVSYYDYYQPEAYMPASDTYIEKDAQINKEIDRLRHATTQALLTRRDVIIVASVSCIYGLGSPEEYERVNLKLEIGMTMDRLALMRKLIEIHFERTNADLAPGTFRSIGSRVEFMPVSETFMYQVEFGEGPSGGSLRRSRPVLKGQVLSGLNEDSSENRPRGQRGPAIVKITKIDPVSSKILKEEKNLFIFPAKHFITEEDKLKIALKNIRSELNTQLKKFQKEGRLLEAERLKRRTNYDLAMIREIGYCNGIENYSRHLSGKKEGEPPETLLSYFPRRARENSLRNLHSVLKGQDSSYRSEDFFENIHEPDFLTIIDESHVTLPQLEGMYGGDASRKRTLVEYGFRLPSARDNRPLKYGEFEEKIGSVIYTSATPGEREKEESEQVVEQIIRPTGLVDPETVVRPVSTSQQLQNLAAPSASGNLRGQNFTAVASSYPGQVQDFIDEAKKTIKKGFRAMATTLTKKMAEDLTLYLKDQQIKAEYLHSDIKTIERIKILSQFRKGEFDVLVGVNLLREGLDLPEVALIGILDADKEGFLRSGTSLIQTIGRAARNAEGKVVLYADIVTGSMEEALKETKRRRDIQIAYNKKHGITPKTIEKKIKDITEEFESEHKKAVGAELSLDLEVFKNARKRAMQEAKRTSKNLSDEEVERLTYDKIIKIKEKEMSKAVKDLDFESAAILRDEIISLRDKQGKR